MPRITYTLTRGDDETELDVDYKIYGSEHNNGPDGIEIEVESIEGLDGELTDAEDEALNQWLYDNGLDMEPDYGE